MEDKNGISVIAIILDDLKSANKKLDTLLDRTAKTGLRSKINSFQIYAIWSAIGAGLAYILTCGGLPKQ